MLDVFNVCLLVELEKVIHLNEVNTHTLKSKTVGKETDVVMLEWTEQLFLLNGL